MALLDYLGSSIKDGVINLVSGAQSWVKGMVTNSLTSAVDTLAETAVKSTEKQIKSSLAKISCQLGTQSKEMVNAAQAVVEQGIIDSNQKVQQAINIFDELMQKFRAELDTKKVQGECQESVLNLTDGEALYKSLFELGKTFKDGKIKLEEFAKQGKSSIENAKPKIEEIIGKAFVEAILNPILSFFTDLVSSLFKSVFQDLSDGLAKGKPANYQQAEEVVEENTQNIRLS
jgi:hypothetical protein